MVENQCFNTHKVSSYPNVAKKLSTFIFRYYTLNTFFHVDFLIIASIGQQLQRHLSPYAKKISENNEYSEKNAKLSQKNQ